MIVFTIAFTASLILSIIFTPIVRKIALHYKVVDKPNKRKVHDVGMPRLGGIAVYASFIAVFYLTMFCGKFKQQGDLGLPHNFLIGFGAGSLIIVILGTLDDIFQLRPMIKLAMQLLAAGTVITFGLTINSIYIPHFGVIQLGPFGILLTLFWIVGITNAINLIDGLDGLAAGVTFIAAMILFLISISEGRREAAMFSVVLAGSIMGFLKYNFNPAQIFLGDSGALFLGFALANFGLVTAMKTPTAVALLIPIVALGFPIMDTFLAMARRTARALKQGKGLVATFKEIGIADREHVHHKLLDLGFTHKKTVVLLYGICLVFGLFAFTLTAYKDQVAGTILFFVALIVFVMVRVLGDIEFHGLKEGNFLEQYLDKISKSLKDKETKNNKEDDK